MKIESHTDTSIFDLNDFPEMLLLTVRERQVMELLLLGYTAKGVAQNLNISFRTVEVYIDKIKKKFQCSTKIELMQKLIQCLLNKLICT